MPSTGPEHSFTRPGSEVYESLLVPMIFEPYAHDVIGRLTGMRRGAILEVAAGTGVVTRAMARALPDAVSITATDLSRPMLDEGIARGTERPVRWEQADVMSLPFGDDSFDVVVCQFGAMFFDRKADAFAEMRRVLRPGGQLLCTVWDRLDANEFADTVSNAVGERFADDPPEFVERIPHGYHDPGIIVGDVRGGGFDAPVIEQLVHTSRAATAAEPAIAFCTGTPLRGEIERRGDLAGAVAAATDAVTRRFGATDLEGRMSAHLVTAAKTA